MKELETAIASVRRELHSLSNNTVGGLPTIGLTVKQIEDRKRHLVWLLYFLHETRSFMLAVGSPDPHHIGEPHQIRD
jgi:hypothetical protein